MQAFRSTTVRTRAWRAIISAGHAATLFSLPTLLITDCDSRNQKQDASSKPIPVDVVKVRQDNASLNGNWVGTIDAFVNAQIQPQVSGYLIQQNYREGSTVEKDEVLFEIDPRPFQATVNQAEAQVAQAKGQLAQAEAQQGLAQINLKRDAPFAQARAIAQSQLDTEKQQAAQADAAVVAGGASVDAPRPRWTPPN